MMGNLVAAQSLQYPSDRYYYGWYNQPPQSKPTDGDIKSEVVDRLRVNRTPRITTCRSTSSRAWSS